jgi:hypothetical protein
MGRNDILSPAEREYLTDPETFGADRAAGTVRKVRHDFRQKWDSMTETRQLMARAVTLWDIEDDLSPMPGKVRCFGCDDADRHVELRIGSKERDVLGYDHWFRVDRQTRQRQAFLIRGFCPECVAAGRLDDAIEQAEQGSQITCYRPDHTYHHTGSDQVAACFGAGHIPVPRETFHLHCK